MTRIFKASELIVKCNDKPGLLARVTAPIAEARVNVNALCAYRMGADAQFHILTGDNGTAKKFLEKAGFRTEDHDVIVLETQNEAGTLFRAAQQLAQAGVDLDYCYATAGNAPGSTWIVFSTDAIERAMNVIP
ncbi:MAG: ACT domain-containing protein [Proteobacteria bacterium]|nr:ACT domain-containing protein [Pseudomonadota bacterium]